MIYQQRKVKYGLVLGKLMQWLGMEVIGIMKGVFQGKKH